MREYYNPNLSMDHDKFHSQSSSYENHSFNSYHPSYQDVKNETRAMKQIPFFFKALRKWMLLIKNRGLKPFDDNSNHSIKDQSYWRKGVEMNHIENKNQKGW